MSFVNRENHSNVQCKYHAGIHNRYKTNAQFVLLRAVYATGNRARKIYLCAPLLGWSVEGCTVYGDLRHIAYGGDAW